jgi:hypothetical protein
MNRFARCRSLPWPHAACHLYHRLGYGKAETTANFPSGGNGRAAKDVEIWTNLKNRIVSTNMPTNRCRRVQWCTSARLLYPMGLGKSNTGGLLSWADDL